MQDASMHLGVSASPEQKAPAPHDEAPLKQTLGSSMIRHITDDDVLLGRGALAIGNKGNVRFRNIVSQRKHEYMSTNHRRTKETIARQVMQAVINNKGRFVRKIDNAVELEKFNIPENEEAWVVADDDAILQKVKQSLRDKKPEHRTIRQKATPPVCSEKEIKRRSDHGAESLLGNRNEAQDGKKKRRLESTLASTSYSRKRRAASPSHNDRLARGGESQGANFMAQIPARDVPTQAIASVDSSSNGAEWMASVARAIGTSSANTGRPSLPLGIATLPREQLQALLQLESEAARRTTVYQRSNEGSAAGPSTRIAAYLLQHQEQHQVQAAARLLQQQGQNLIQPGARLPSALPDALLPGMQRSVHGQDLSTRRNMQAFLQQRMDEANVIRMQQLLNNQRTFLADRAGSSLAQGTLSTSLPWEHVAVGVQQHRDRSAHDSSDSASAYQYQLQQLANLIEQQNVASQQRFPAPLPAIEQRSLLAGMNAASYLNAQQNLYSGLTLDSLVPPAVRTLTISQQGQDSVSRAPQNALMASLQGRGGNLEMLRSNLQSPAVVASDDPAAVANRLVAAAIELELLRQQLGSTDAGSEQQRR